jgi:hypothetical protein|tara:strand:+ start:1854 stop:2399 length:546 start_codon:yes stop_codon:yes gene_type:complete
MKTVKVEIKGLSPLLMNSPKSMIDQMTESKLKQTTKKIDVYKDADKLAYKLDNGELYVPSEAIKGCLVRAASYKKFGKNSARPIIAGGVHITPNKIGLGTKKYEVDVRTVVIQRARVVKGRPTIENWKLSFDLNYNDILIGDSNEIKSILEEAGSRIGILDFRPDKLGSFGMFEVTKWEEK